MRTSTFISACICVVFAMLAPTAANGNFLAGPTSETHNKVHRAEKELRQSEHRLRDTQLAFEREKTYAEGTNMTLAKLEKSVNRAKRDRKEARVVLAEAKK